MRNRLTVATAASLVLASTAAAQTDIGSGNIAGHSWRGPIADAFFADDSMLILRPHPEIMSNWRNLSEMERERVRQDCAAAEDNDNDNDSEPRRTGSVGDADAEGTGRLSPVPAPDAEGPGSAPQVAPGGDDAGAVAEASPPGPFSDDAPGGRGGGTAVSVAGSRSLAEICSIIRTM